jgi:hypothetical protein
MQYSNLLKGFIEELDDCYVLLKKKEGSSSLDAEYIFKSLQDDKVASLKEIVDDIRELLDTRAKLHKEIFADLEKAKLAIGNQLAEPVLTDEDRTKLRIALIEIDQKKADEKLNAFRDISELRKELREHLKEYQDKRKRADLLEKLV